MRSALAALIFAFAFFLAVRASAFEVPELTGRVVDQAGKLTEAERATIEAKLAAFDRDTSNQIVVFITPSLGGETIEDVSYKVAKAWKIGQAGKDNGVLLTVAPGDRKIRIETGKGVGGALTDLQSNDIIMRRIGPELKQEHFFQGISNGVDDIIGALHPGWTYEGKQYLAPKKPAPNVPAFWLIAIPILFVLMIFLGRRRRNAGWATTGYIAGDSSWSGGGDSGGGGGFSGGGGDFGGGGSSGSY